jgi:integrase
VGPIQSGPVSRCGLDFGLEEPAVVAATLALCRVRPKVVQERLGHSSIMITKDTYSHVVQGMQAEAEKLADLLR